MNKTIILFIMAAALMNIGTLAQINYDENKIPSYSLPEILSTPEIQNNNSKKKWKEIRRPEILNLFKKNIYGFIPSSEINVAFKLYREIRSDVIKNAILKNVRIFFSNNQDTHTADLLIYLPDKNETPVPLFLGLNFFGNHTINKDGNIPITKSWVRNNSEYFIFDNSADERSRGIREYRWPVEMMLEKGYGLATIYYGDLDPDYDDEFKNGIHKLLNYDSENKIGGRSSISAWAYGLSAAMDYFETDDTIDEEKIAVFGHSRLGKTALWAGAIDERFAMVISNNSGCGGAALSRRKIGETVKQINTQFPHWFSENFHNYNNRENDLPVDQHMLIALISPRPVYIASAVEDKWADPRGEFLALFHAGPAYKIYGHEIIQVKELPDPNNPIIRGKLGYHIRSGKHDITKYDWEQFLKFADRHFNQSDTDN